MPTTFTMPPPRAPLPSPPVRPKRLAPLGKFKKDYTSPGVYEITEAATKDGEWLFRRSDDSTWMTGHLPTRTVVKSPLGSLHACRAYVGSGKARADFEQIKSGSEENSSGE